ncbi:peptidoglycan-binding domain-containing protein [Candidatus Clostridium helianthi]|uniref:Peptidoglycan-binding protein n=1 Tax=Candidatus Clostridium helianthi TaxID=3381660 RepID=A0ABW8S7G9_9CLOT
MGSDVLDVQGKINEKGYYPRKLDGIYGEGINKFVIEFRKDNSIKECNDINKELYEKPGITLVD